MPWILKESGAEIGSIFIEALDSAFEAASMATNGRWTRVVFRYDPFEHPTEEFGKYDIVRVDFEKKYTQKSQGLHLYNTALRQADPMSRYLNYYRILEWATGNNGKGWIEETLKEKALEYEGEIWCYRKSLPWKKALIPSEIKKWIRANRLGREKERINLLEVMRGHALSRLEELSGSMTEKKIAEVLYHENRCGIAHGGKIKLHGIGNNFKDIMNDLKLLRYLARIAISPKLI